jgi:hypothetical protein
MSRIQTLFLGVALIAGVGAAQAGFWDQLTPAERRAAGLDQLTPEQQAALNRLAEHYLHAVTGPVGEQAKQEIREAVTKEVREQVRAEVKQELQKEEKTKAAAQAGLPAEESQTVVRTRVVGEFHGWSGATVFHLENGQVWVQSNSDDVYWVPTMMNPEVEIRPSKLGGWKLYLGDKGAWLRVRRVR